MESIKAEPAVMLPVGDKKYTTPCLSGLCMLYIEKKKLFVQLQLIWICSSVCVLSHIDYYAFLFLQFFWNDWHRTILCADIRADIDTYAVSLGDRFPGEDRSNERPCERVTCSYGISNLYLRCLKI